ncbi:MAG: RpiB/LacA/LacB family sugar-phosphate isomerase [bacterium]|nr:RpiB/LacA/LacB family sugar-phosphate isomerase [bacterium]
MNIGIVSDHRGFNLKEEIIKNLEKKYTIIDLGPSSNTSTDYPIYAKKLADNIINKKIELGIAICSTGTGMTIALNKIKNIYCAKVSNTHEAKLAKLHNNANTIALAETTPIDVAINIIGEFINTNFSNEEKHIRRITQIKEIETND